MKCATCSDTRIVRRAIDGSIGDYECEACRGSLVRGMDPSYAHNRRPENRRIYAEQEISWAYTALLKAQHGLFNCVRESNDSAYFADALYWTRSFAHAERHLAEAHERHLKACAALGPATLTVTWQHPDGFVVILRDACGFIRFHGSGYGAAYYAVQDADRAAINLGLEVE